MNFNHTFKSRFYGFNTQKKLSLSSVVFLFSFLILSSHIIACSSELQSSTSTIFNGFRTINVDNVNTCNLDIKSFTGESITVEFSGLPANQPSTYKNFIAIWESSVIPWVIKPLRKIEIEVNTEAGTLTIDGLIISKNSYVIGYGVGSDIGDISASAVLQRGRSRSPSLNVNFEIKDLKNNVLSVGYKTLYGYLSKSNGNWIGLWEGYVSPYNLPPNAIAKTEVNNYSNEGVVELKDLSLADNIVYTLIYFMGSDPNTAAAILTFNTSNQTLNK